ncbi:hypothetical protein ACYULU_15905 [Breznakiellaceae bacterium SP9]
MADQARLDRLNQGLDKLNTEGKQYIERLTSRLLHSSQDPAGQYMQGCLTPVLESVWRVEGGVEAKC